MFPPRNRLGGFGGGSNVVRGIKTGAYNVFGDYPQIIKQDPLGITSGRFINRSDIEQKRKVAIIGSGVKKELYDRGEDPIGTYILSLIHISEPTRRTPISYAVFCLKKK